LYFNYEASIGTGGRPADVRDTVQAILTAGSSFPGRFRIEQAGDVFHIIPTRVRNERGDWVTQTSVLDARITLPRQEMNGYQMLNAITDAVSEATGIRVGLGSGPANSLFRHVGYLEADNEVARDVLLRTLHSMSDRFTWWLFYGPDVKWYALNVRVVAASEMLDRAQFEPPPADPDQPPAFGPRE
jgi:hypothetical protein